LIAEENPSVAMYELTQKVMREAGRPAYEISNHAKPGEESRHNLTYWHYEDYIGVGPGAHGRYRASQEFHEFINAARTVQSPSRLREGLGAGGEFASLRASKHLRLATDNHRAPDVWLREVEAKGCGMRQAEELDTNASMREALMMGLRLVDGIDLEKWHAKFDAPIESLLSPEKLQRLASEKYILRTDTRMQATASGLQRLNAILSYLIA
jgi:coproporphyrinogen III oxidase-like Fe-S oxidoreductase